MTSRHLWLASAAVIPTLALSAQASAQSLTLEPPQLRQNVDAQGVDLSTGELVMPSSSVSIGGERGLSHRRYRVPNGWRHNYILSIADGSSDLGATLRVQIGGSLREFLIDDTDYIPLYGETGTLVSNAGGYLYTDAAGTEYQFDTAPVANGESYYEAVQAVGTSITRPDGFVTTLTYRGDNYTDGGGVTLYVVRLQSVNSSTGYQLKYTYETNSPTLTTVDDWYELSQVTAINTADEYCDPTSDSCSLSGSWPQLSYSKAAIANNETMEYVTDQANRTVQFRIDQIDRLVGVRHAGHNEHATVSYDANDRVYVHVNFLTGYRRDYAWSNDLQGNLVVTATDNADTDRASTVVTDPSTLQVLTETDAYGRTTGYTYDSDGRLTLVSNPGDTRIQYDYDSLGRMYKVTRIGKQTNPTIPRDEIVVSELTFPANCANPVTCYKPLSSEDALGNVTNYTWDQTHGGLLQVQLPPASPGDPRPTTVINYATHQARYKDASGALIDGAPLTLTNATFQCINAATCFGTADELRTLFSYGSTGANNLQVTQVTRKSGNASIVQATKFTYDSVGNPLTVDGPLPGTDDTVTYVYDNAYQVVGTISPDPDGTGPQPHLAERTTYDNRGIAIKVESGTVTGTDSAAWAAFSPYQEYNTAIDSAGRPTSVTHKVPGGAEISRTAYAYDYAGRLECTAVRMDPTTWASATDACVQSSSTNTDRIGRSYYDYADRVFETWSGVGTPLAQATVKVQYNAADGTVDWVEDAKGNRTGYTYDDHFRTTAINYPDKTTAGTISTSDSESITYDDANRITSYTNRAGEVFNFTYDNLNRLTVKDVPYDAARANHTRDVHYVYDLFGNLTQARFDSTAGEGVIFHYNALGQNYYQYIFMDSEPRGVSRFFDQAGRLTTLGHPDGEQFRYSYDTMGRLDKVFQGPPVGTVTLADTTYSNVGNMTRMDRSPGSMRTDYSFDAAGRVSSRDMNVNTGGTYRNVMTQSYNAANQATVETNSNAAYAAGGVSATQIDYTANGLNQYGTVAASTYSYDANGNLTSDGTTSYSYDTENRLITVSGPSNNATLTYDPLGRLWQVEDGVGNKRRMLYDGDALIAESAPGATYAPDKRFVHGVSGGDDPLVMYNGPTVALANARFLNTDMRGSVIAEVDSTGIPDRLPRYDEFGVHMAPVSGISSTPSRFGYTGQVWVPEAGLYYYKARMYSPTLGRFMQTDPIGYGDGMNNLAYVGNDAVNRIDPTGEAFVECLGLHCDDSPAAVGSAFQSNNDSLGANDFRGGNLFGYDPSQHSSVFEAFLRPLVADAEQLRKDLARANRICSARAFRSISAEDLAGSATAPTVDSRPRQQPKGRAQAIASFGPIAGKLLREYGKCMRNFR